MDDSSKVEGAVPLSNAFSREYLERLREGSETFGSGEGEAAGPWELRHQEGAYPLFRAWEGFEHGDSPEAVFQLREAGLLFFAVRLRIPSESGHPFRREGGHHSDVKAATHSEAKAATHSDVKAATF